MKLPNFANNQTAQTLVVLLLVLSFLFAEWTTYLVAGQTNAILAQLFYLPVIFFSFRYAQRAVLCATVLAIIYLGGIFVTTGPQINELAPAIMQFYVYISIGIVVGALSSKIRDSEIKYRELFNQSADAVFLLNIKSMTIVEANQKFREIFGVSGGEEVSLNRIISDDNLVITLVHLLSDGKPVSDLDFSVSAGTSGSTDFVLNATSIDAYGLTLVTLADVSRIKREDAQSLAESEAKFRSLVELAQEGICSIDANGIATYVNPKLIEMLGYSEKELLGHSLFEHMGERTWVESPDHPDLSQPKAGVESEFEFIRKDGERILTNLSVTPITDRSGMVTGAMALVTDITEKKKGEAALRESEERFHTIFESQMTGALLIDATTHTILDLNEKAISLIGRPKEEVLGKVCHHFICPAESGACPVTDLGLVIDQSERILLNGKGERIPILKFVKAFTVSDRKYIIETFTDITERKKHEEELKASLEEKSVLLMEIHHRVKNNLQIISGLIRLQSRHINNRQAVEALQECENRVITMALVHESLYQSGNLAVINARQHFTHLGSNLLVSVEQDRPIKLATDIEEIQLDLNTAIPCSLIVNELVTNSMKYAFKGSKGGTITIGLHKEPSGMLRLSVADDGSGLPADFDVGKATSLGLKLVHRLVRDQLKGTIEIHRENGTEFVIQFSPIIPLPKKQVLKGS